MAKIKMQKIELIYNLTSDLIDQIENNEGYKENTKYNVDYFSIDSDYILDTTTQDKVEEFGAHYVLFYLYLKTQMLLGGKYYINKTTTKRIIKNYCVMYCADLENIQEIFADYILTKTIFVLNTETLGEIITDPFVVYNYRLVMEKRLYNRLKKQEERAEEKEQQEEIKNNKEEKVPEAPEDFEAVENFDCW